MRMRVLRNITPEAMEMWIWRNIAGGDEDEDIGEYYAGGDEDTEEYTPEAMRTRTLRIIRRRR